MRSRSRLRFRLWFSCNSCRCSLQQLRWQATKQYKNAAATNQKQQDESQLVVRTKAPRVREQKWSNLLCKHGTRKHCYVSRVRMLGMLAQAAGKKNKNTCSPSCWPC